MDSQFCGDCKFTCLISLTETIVFMALFLYQYKVMSESWAELKPKETELKSFTLKKKIAFVILLQISLILEVVFNNFKPYMILVPFGCKFIVYTTMIKILYEDNKFFNQSRKQFRRFIKYPFIFQLLQTINFVLIDGNIWMSFFQLLNLFYFYEYLVDKSCNLQVKDLKKHIKDCEKLNLVCNSNINLNLQKNSKQFLDETPTLYNGLLSTTYHRDTPEFDNFGTDLDNDESDNEEAPVKISFGRTHTLKKVVINEIQNDYYEITYELDGIKQKQTLLKNVLMDFMKTIKIENDDLTQIWKDENNLNYFSQYIEANNKQEWCENFKRQEVIVTFMKKSQ